jgi:hypothetical protein
MGKRDAGAAGVDVVRAREALAADPQFNERFFASAKQQVRAMEFRFVRLADDSLSTIFEVYARYFSGLKATSTSSPPIETKRNPPGLPLPRVYATAGSTSWQRRASGRKVAGHGEGVLAKDRRDSRDDGGDRRMRRHAAEDGDIAAAHRPGSSGDDEHRSANTNRWP